MLVNRAGERFVNEDTYTGRIGMRALLEQDGDVFMIVSEEIFEVNFVGMRLQWAAETAEELARDIGLPEAALARDRRRLQRRTRRAARTPSWHKLPPFLVPLRAPLGAVDLRVDQQAIYAPFTLGGLATDVDGRVLDAAGAPGPGSVRGRPHHRRDRGRRLRERDLARRRQLLRPPRRRRAPRR